MLNIFLDTYRWLFARVIFHKFNKLLYVCSLHGLGIRNYKSDKASGEKFFLTKILSVLPQNACVVDVGANIGNYSKAVLAGAPTATVIAFEPHPKTFKRLSESMGSSKFTAVNAAVGDQNGKLSLYDYSAGDGSEHASLFKDVIEGIHNSKAIEHQVQVVRLGDFLVRNNIDFVDLLKVDTEGNELAVLMGVAEFLQKNKIGVIHFEFNEMNVPSRTFFKDFWSLMPNYHLFRLLPSGMLPIEVYRPIFSEIFAYQNIVAINKLMRVK